MTLAYGCKKLTKSGSMTWRPTRVRRAGWRLAAATRAAGSVIIHEVKRLAFASDWALIRCGSLFATHEWYRNEPDRGECRTGYTPSRGVYSYRSNKTAGPGRADALRKIDP
jgi:hypothetical protein